MALQPKKGGTIHSKTGDAKNALKAKYDAGDHTVLENYPGEAALLYQMQQMSEDIDELRRYIVALAPDEKPLPTISTASHTVDFTVTNSRGAYALVITVVDSSGSKPVTKTTTINLS